MADEYDVVVIGAGPGGYIAAIRAAQLGMKVACIEKSSTLGGTCLNIGCIPSKSLLDSSEFFYLAKEGLGEHGIQCGQVKLDLQQMMKRKQKVVKGLTDGVAHLFKKNKLESIEGEATLTSAQDVTVKKGKSKKEVRGKSILLATGSVPAELPSLKFDGEHIVSSTEALSFDEVPKHLIVIGGGYIGLELGSVWSRLGSKVTVIEFLPRILANSDSDMSAQLQRLLKRQGLEFHLETKVTGANIKGKKITVQAEQKGDDLTFEGDKVLLAVGRKPCIDGLGLEEVGVTTDEKSKRVLVDENFQTNVEGIYAIGDLIEGPMLAHKAQVEGIAFAEKLAGKPGLVNYNAIPSVVFTMPELASVGKTEDQLKEEERDYKVGKFYFKANGRARSLNETDGIVKVLTDSQTDRILGVDILGPHASDLIAEVTLAMEYGASAEDIARTCHAHPTLPEAVMEAARDAWGVPLHS